MWWIIILALIAWMFIRFFSDKSKQSNIIKEQGGMKKVYSTLVNHLLLGDPNSRIIEEGGDYIVIGVSGISGSTGFVITQTFATVTIQYKVNSNVFGNHKLEWEFMTGSSQVDMITKIENDIINYNKHTLNKFI